ncbi:MAG: ornithine carbamoyltransferase [bacterium]
MKKDFLSITDCDRDQLFAILLLAQEIKKNNQPAALAQKNIGLLFEKHSTRTRLSFEVGINQLGGSALILSSQDMQISRGESIADTGKVIERFLDALAARVFSHSMLETLAANCSIPIINALSDREHPCQILADFLTILEKKKHLQGITIAYLGDGNNVANSLLLGAPIAGANIRIATPEKYAIRLDIAQQASNLAKEYNTEVTFTTNPHEAVTDANVLYTDTWISMGDSEEKQRDTDIFHTFQVNNELVKKARPDAIVMHCLPAHRGEEITDEILDGSQSAVWDEAENRLHAQKALLLNLLK